MGIVLPRVPFCDWTKAGQFGDSFGALTCLVTALGFGIVIINMWRDHRVQTNLEIRRINDERKRVLEKNALAARQLEEDERRHRDDRRRAFQELFLYFQNRESEAEERVRLLEKKLFSGQSLQPKSEDINKAREDQRFHENRRRYFENKILEFSTDLSDEKMRACFISHGHGSRLPNDLHEIRSNLIT